MEREYTQCFENDDVTIIELTENVKRIELQNKMMYDKINKNIKNLTQMIYPTKINEIFQ